MTFVTRPLTVRELRSRRRRQALKLAMALLDQRERGGVHRSSIGRQGHPWDEPELWRAWQIGHHAGRLFALRELAPHTTTERFYVAGVRS